MAPSASALNRKLIDNGQSLVSIDALCSTITELCEEQLEPATLIAYAINVWRFQERMPHKTPASNAYVRLHL